MFGSIYQRFGSVGTFGALQRATPQNPSPLEGEGRVGGLSDEHCKMRAYR